jgi:hypothetical protein
MDRCPRLLTVDLDLVVLAVLDLHSTEGKELEGGIIKANCTRTAKSQYPITQGAESLISGSVQWLSRLLPATSSTHQTWAAARAQFDLCFLHFSVSLLVIQNHI